MRLGLGHHVFSSEGGYKTMHVSPALRPMVTTLEGFAKRVYKKVKREPLFAVLGLDGAFALSKTFVAGSDHVGRLRGCVHTIVPDAAPLRAEPFFNPFDLLGGLPFLGEGVNLLAVAGELEPDVEFAPGTALAVPKLDVTEELAQAVFTGMLSPHHEAVACDPRGEVRDLIARLYLLLPPFVRSGFSVLLGAHLPPIEDSTRIDFFALPGNTNMKEYVDSGRLVVDVPRGKLENVPAPSPYCKMVMDACFGRSDGTPLKKLLSLMERNAFSAEPTWDVLRSLVEAFSHVERLVTADGKVATSADPGAALKAVVLFARGGYADLALEILRGAAEQAAAKSDTGEFGPGLMQLARKVEGNFEQLKRRPAVLFQRLGQLSDELMRYLAQGRSRQAGEKGQDEIIDTMLSWDF